MTFVILIMTPIVFVFCFYFKIESFYLEKSRTVPLVQNKVLFKILPDLVQIGSLFTFYKIKFKFLFDLIQ